NSRPPCVKPVTKLEAMRRLIPCAARDVEGRGTLSILRRPPGGICSPWMAGLPRPGADVEYPLRGPPQHRESELLYFFLNFPGAHSVFSQPRHRGTVSVFRHVHEDVRRGDFPGQGLHFLELTERLGDTIR